MPMKKHIHLFVSTIALSFLFSFSIAQKQRALPRVAKSNGKFQLYVDGKPFLMLGAQLWNSSAWPAITDKFWPQLRELNANTLEAPIYWQNIEPEPGKFNFKELDDLILNARREKLKLVLLWFGSWKNGNSYYIPTWMQENPEKYPRMLSAAGEELMVLSPVSGVNRDADKRAFTEMVRHVKTMDSQDQTVIMIQVQNEPGSLATDRDYSPAANKLFNDPVPVTFVNAMKKQPGTWTQVFGVDAPETFNAYHIASYINDLAKEGKAIYNLPMFANAWTRENLFHKPGDYPSGGPTSNMLEVWKTAAPDLDFLAPDLYVGNPNAFNDLCDKYDRPDNMLIIPETGNGATFARFHFYAIGNYNAKGVAVYGIDPFHADPNDNRTMDKLDERFADIADNYKILSRASAKILALQESGKLKAVGEEQGLREQLINLEGYDVLFEYGYPTYKDRGRQSGRALIGQLSENEFLLVGFDTKFRFRPKYGSGFSKAEYVLVEEGYYEGETWVRERIWNGDETYHSTLRPHGSILKIRLRKVKSAATGPDRANFEQN
jgi:beta-galactosidase GanA